MAQPTVRNQYILVIIDANKYNFKDRLLAAGSEGGEEAAKILLGYVRSTMARLGLNEDFRVVVRIFADFAALSKKIPASTLSRKQSHSVGSFASGFNGSEALFDFMDSGGVVQQKSPHNDNFKVFETFRMFAGTSQCGHIVLGACNSWALMDMLRPYRGLEDKITLLRPATPSIELEGLGFCIEDYADVFSAITEHDGITARPSIAPANPPQRTISPPDRQSTPGRPSPDPPRRINDAANSESSSEDAVTLNKAAIRRPTVRINPNSKYPEDRLPVPNATNEKLIPVNIDGDRLDTYLAKPAPRALQQYHDRANQQKLCNDHHLLGWCKRGSTCNFDHSPITDVIRQVQRKYCRDYPCPLSTSCRRLNCFYAHVCTRYGCPGPSIHCRMLPSMHKISLDVAHWVKPDDAGQNDDDIAWLEKKEREQLHGIKEIKWKPRPYKGESEPKFPRAIRSKAATCSGAEFSDDFM